MIDLISIIKEFISEVGKSGKLDRIVTVHGESYLITHVAKNHFKVSSASNISKVYSKFGYTIVENQFGFGFCKNSRIVTNFLFDNLLTEEQYFQESTLYDIPYSLEDMKILHTDIKYIFEVLVVKHRSTNE